MKAFSRSVSLSMLAAVLFLSGCSDGIKSFTLEDIGGDAFPFHSPITALAESNTDGALLVGTTNGVIASFSTEDGLFTQLDREGDGKTIYDIAVDKGRPFYAVAVRDGGVHIKNSWGEKADTVRIRGKDTEYSPYKILLDSNGQQLYLGTSNGFHRYPLDEQKRGDPAIAIKKDDKNGPLSFFSVIKMPADSGVVFAGKHGAFVTVKGEEGDYHSFGGIQSKSDFADTVTVLALHDGFFLLEDGSLWKNYESPERVCNFVHSPLNYVIENDYVYAISVSLVEVLNLNDMEEAYAIRLPEKHLNRARNKSCRQNGLVKDNYLYVAPGGTSLYRIPLAPYDRGEEVVSLCKGEGNGNGIYALTARNDLYSVRVDPTCNNPETSRYKFSFNKEDQVRLLGTGSDKKLVVSVNDTIYSFSGHNLSKEPLYRTDLKGENEKITCNFWTDGTLYQGRKDNVRAYHAYSDSVLTLPKRKDDCLECRPGVLDYYPSRMAMARCNGKDILVVGTLHSGLVFRDLSDTAALFTLMLSKSKYSRLLDIQAIDNTVYVLDDKRLSRFSFEVDNSSKDESVRFSSDSVLLLSAGCMREYLNRIVPLSSDECYVFSDFYDFSSGAYYCRFPVYESPGQDSLLFQGRTINDALLVNGGNVLFGGRRGIMSNDADGSPFSIRKPKLYERLLFSWWPWSLVLLTIGLAFLVGAGCLVYRWIRSRSIRKEKERKAQEIVKEVEGWHRILDELTMETYEAHLKDVEDEENRLGLSSRKVTDYKRDELFRKIVSLIEHQDVENLEKCELAIEKAGVARERISEPEIRAEIDSIINEFKKRRFSLIDDEKTKLAEGEKKALVDKYKGEYVVTLFNTLVEESDLCDLKTNIGSFKKEDSIQVGGKTVDRLKLLDMIGQIISDALTITTCEAEEKKTAAELLSALEGIAKRYDLIPVWFESRKRDGVFLSWSEVKQLENKERRKASEIQRAASARCNDELEYFDLYTGLREKMNESYEDYVMDFFNSYSIEKDRQDAEYKKVFVSLDDVTNHKLFFALFPICAIPDVGVFLFEVTREYFQKERSIWKGPTDKRDKMHHFPHLTKEKKYGGLFGLMAKTGFASINKQLEGENRGRPQRTKTE